MEFVDFIGKLNDHEEYLKIIDILKKKSHYIEIVIIDDKYSSGLSEIFKADIISKKIVSKWWGTSGNARNKMYKIKVSNALFSKLKEYETFCKYYVDLENGDHVETTDFGYDDIAFFDDNIEPLLFTTSHEGYVTAREDLLI